MLATKYEHNYSSFPSIEHLTSLDNVQQFVIFSQKFVCIIFCRVISQQSGGSGDLRYEVFVIAILHYHKFMNYRYLKKIKVVINFGSTCINFNNVYNKF